MDTTKSAAKKMNRSNKSQIKYLCDYMHSHPDFAAGDYKTPQGASQQERQWAQLKAALDELGPNRSIDQWKVCWRDQKRKARAEGAALNKAKNSTGNYTSIPDISDNAAVILDTIGSEMAVGVGPEESPIGFIKEIPSAVPTLTPTTEYYLTPLAAPTKKARRIRKSHPPDRFLNAQTELNSLVKVLIEEVKRGNQIQEERNRIEDERNRIIRRRSRSPPQSVQQSQGESLGT